MKGCNLDSYYYYVSSQNSHFILGKLKCLHEQFVCVFMKIFWNEKPRYLASSIILLSQNSHFIQKKLKHLHEQFVCVFWISNPNMKIS